jgi:hypothetical protein
MVLDGTILFARYAFMPNRLDYCGGDDNETLFEHCVANHSDPDLVHILEQFQAAIPYLRLIAASNGIADLFDIRVVEAYWIGNRLLDRVDLARFYNALNERFANQLSSETLGHLLSKPPLGARPHHSFHVFDVHSRVGMLNHSIDNVENCRIGWGRVKEIRRLEHVIEYQPLVLRDGLLKLGDLSEKRVLHQIEGSGFVSGCSVGDWISFHWNWACDVLSLRQVQNLEWYTRYHLKLANRTL